MGGQVGDTGKIVHPQGTFVVQTTRSVGGYVLHIGQSDSRIRRGDRVTIFGRLVSTFDSTTSHPRRICSTGRYVKRWVKAFSRKDHWSKPIVFGLIFSHGKPLDRIRNGSCRVARNRANFAGSDGLYSIGTSGNRRSRSTVFERSFGEKYPPRRTSGFYWCKSRRTTQRPRIDRTGGTIPSSFAGVPTSRPPKKFRIAWWYRKKA
ncbi:MAG: hypothetical protein KatS3mg104_1454 [Phycisphaerae bacterium]|nr:MAG: hypothetical protein KatS3mg104_1454 [Phycisphaerae bacterium]